MAEIEISPARLELSRQGLEGMVNGRKFQIREKLSSASKRNRDSGLENSIAAAEGCFSVIDAAWSRLAQGGLLEKSSPKPAIFASYLGADYGLSLLDDENGGRARAGERNFFTNERADFGRMYPLFLDDLLSTYSRALDSQAGIGLSLLTGQYLSWIRERALSEGERLPDFEKDVSDIRGKIGGTYEFSGLMKRRAKNGSACESEYTWENFGGYKEQVGYFKDLALIISNWDECARLGFSKKGELLPKGILLVGPPGTGKTRLAMTFCYESGIPFEMIGVSDVGSSFVYETANNMQRKFDAAASYIKSGESQVSVLFMDELDSLGEDRDRSSGGTREDNKVVTTIAQNMDSPKSVDGVIVIGTTNRPGAIDSSLTRGKRFEEELYLGPVTRADAGQIFRRYLGNCPGVNIDRIVNEYVADFEAKPLSRGGKSLGQDGKMYWSGADITSLASAIKRQKMIEHLKSDVPYRLTTDDVIGMIQKMYG